MRGEGSVSERLREERVGGLEICKYFYAWQKCNQVKKGWLRASQNKIQLERNKELIQNI